MGQELTLHGEVARFDAGYTEVAPGTWAYMQPNGGLGESNSGLISTATTCSLLTRSGTTTHGQDAQRRTRDRRRCARDALQYALRRRHVWGNQLFTGARIISTSTSKKLMTLDPRSHFAECSAAAT